MDDTTRVQLNTIVKTAIYNKERFTLPGGKEVKIPFFKNEVINEAVKQAYELGVIPDPWVMKGSSTSKRWAHEANTRMVSDLVDRELRVREEVAGQQRRKYLAWQDAGGWLWQRADYIRLHQLYTIKSDYEARAAQMEARADGVYDRIRELEEIKDRMGATDAIRFADVGMTDVAI